MIADDDTSAFEGQPDAAALFAFDRHARSGRALYPFVLPVIVLLVLAALKLDDALRPPLWLHALIWPPVTFAAMFITVRLAQRAFPPRNGEGDHAQHGGGVGPDNPVLSGEAPSRGTPPPPCGRSPSPSRGGQA